MQEWRLQWATLFVFNSKMMIDSRIEWHRGVTFRCHSCMVGDKLKTVEPWLDEDKVATLLQPVLGQCEMRCLVYSQVQLFTVCSNSVQPPFPRFPLGWCPWVYQCSKISGCLLFSMWLVPKVSRSAYLYSLIDIIFHLKLFQYVHNHPFVAPQIFLKTVILMVFNFHFCSSFMVQISK